jgi:signal peptidase I
MGSQAQRLRVELLAEALRVSGEARVRVHGGSMWPWVRGGDVLIVRRASLRALRRGDIVLYARDARLFAHRLLRLRRSAGGRAVLITKGDTLAHTDAPISAEEFLGRVEAVERNGRIVSLRSLPAALLGRLAARFTRAGSAWYPLARAARRLLPRR